MKVKCIYKGDYVYLTIGKIYDITNYAKDNCWYSVINDRGSEIWYEKELFKSLSEIRNDNIDKLLE